MNKRPSCSFLMQAGVPGEALESGLRLREKAARDGPAVSRPLEGSAVDPERPLPWWLRLKRLLHRRLKA